MSDGGTFHLKQDDADRPERLGRSFTSKDMTELVELLAF
jgi:hypothetical protein